jgi:hypothetical protein
MSSTNNDDTLQQVLYAYIDGAPADGSAELQTSRSTMEEEAVDLCLRAMASQEKADERFQYAAGFASRHPPEPYTG